MNEVMHAAEKLVESVEFDVNGAMGKGGNGGLISDTSIKAAGALRVAINRAKAPSPISQMVGWTKVPAEPTLEFLKSINANNQVLAYENGRYYNAWFEYEPSEGGWFWTDEADSEPNPSHYRLLSEVALASAEVEG